MATLPTAAVVSDLRSVKLPVRLRLFWIWTVCSSGAALRTRVAGWPDDNH